jgi:hypothetical protein
VTTLIFLGELYIHRYIHNRQEEHNIPKNNNNNNPIVKTVHYMRNYVGIIISKMFVSKTKESSSSWLLLFVVVFIEIKTKRGRRN